MIIDLRTILTAPRHFDFTLEPDWWQGDEEDDQILGLDSPLTVQISISRAGSKYVLDGRLSGRLRLRCGRCLEPFCNDLKSDFRLFLSLPPSDTEKSELELFEEDMSVDFIMGGEIDLDEVVREQIYFSLPIKSLCREDCSGLCTFCGANLNKEECKCRRDLGHPGFSELKNLKLKKG
jgi:uncharacterized protein